MPLEDNTNLDLNEIEVALVLDDINEAKEITKILKGFGIVPHFYNDLLTFWNGVSNLRPDLTIVDVSLMSSGKLSLIDHPQVLSGDLHLSFYYSESTRPLLQSTVGINHLGIMQRQVSYESELKSLIFRLKESLMKKRDIQNLESKRLDLENKLLETMSKVEELKEKKHFDNLLEDILSKRNIYLEKVEFTEVLTDIVGNLESIDGFSIFELNQTTQKLISPPFVNDKYKQLPTLWLGKKSQNGIEFFAQNMATQVGIDVLGQKIVSLSIKSEQLNPEMILLLSVENREFLARFNWELLEGFLSGVYSAIKLKTKDKNRNARKVMNPWEYLSALDTYFYRDTIDDDLNYSNEEPAVVVIDFKLLIQTVRKEVKNRFFWSKFFSDLSRHIEQLQIDDLNICSFGIDTMTVILPKKNHEICIEKLRTLTTNFKYWRYFENPEKIFNNSLKPRIRFSPLSSEGFLKYLENGDLYTSSNFKNKKIKMNEVSLPHEGSVRLDV